MACKRWMAASPCPVLNWNIASSNCSCKVIARQHTPAAPSWPVLAWSENEHIRIEVQQCGCVYFSDAAGYVEKEIGKKLGCARAFIILHLPLDDCRGVG
jgi:hypothetical protein